MLQSHNYDRMHALATPIFKLLCYVTIILLEFFQVVKLSSHDLQCLRSLGSTDPSWSQPYGKLADTLHCLEATCDKINFMYLNIQCKNISCNTFSFFKNKRKYFDNEKRRIYGINRNCRLATLIVYDVVHHVFL